MKYQSSLKALILIAFCATASVAYAEGLDRHDARLTWWRDARFGMFIHWGPVTLTGQEISWSRANSNTNCPNNGSTPVAVYDNLYKNFNPTNFNADEWVSVAKSAGMKYMVLTAKHADGFLLWDSKVDGYNISATPFRRDVCAELAEAAHRQNERLGWYFSPMDWHDPDCRSANNDRFVQKNQAELRELLSHYGKIDVLWFDCDGRPAMWDPTNIYALVHKLQPQILVNNRLEMSTHEQWVHQGRLGANEDFYTPEQTIGAYDDKTPWETCMTLGTQWSWKPDDKIKPAGEVIRILAQCAGGDGNLLLDVGPMPDGQIEPRQIEVLKQVGAWLAKNGESIYGTRGGPWIPTKAIASTRRGNMIYLHVLQWKTDRLELPAFARNIKSATLLNGGKVEVVKQGSQLFVTVAAASLDALDTVVKLQLDGPAADLPVLEVSPKLKATASNVFKNQTAEYGPQFAFDDDAATRWAADESARQAWIAVDLGREQSISGVQIQEAITGRVQKFEFQYRDKSGWKTIFDGSTLGEAFEKHFNPVKAQEFRLNILDATIGPTIRELKLLNN